ncbi:extracellular solute-binding protein [Pseudogemmobacter humi]|uniref:Putrescine-binding periplasmic protein n=1 Tax=Pseudogemmobacter humi TaxID=2483812 RepID=A0A3P5XZ03_9RHOB|nr:extracellular solute-binding protein [Pseudogemmobacter humi]VDC33432.1 Putrescine-binding periplasmic protein precursor [Pseudogemmobacter humi]
MHTEPFPCSTTLRRRYAGLAGLAALVLLASAQPNAAQGLLSVSVGEDGKVRADVGTDGPGSRRTLSEAEARRVATVQRMLARLGYLSEAAITREIDRDTQDAVDAFVKVARLNNPDILSEQFLRALFLAVWAKDNWSSGQADGLDLVVDPKMVRQAQIALRDLGYAPGPSDGVFGPGTFTAIEVFQEDRDMRVDGLLTTNIYEAVMRASSNRDIDYKGEVRVLNWNDYINPETLMQFERETGLRVTYEVFGSLEEADTLMASARKPYDLLMRPGLGIRDMVDQDLVQSIDTAALRNFEEIDPVINTITTNWDPSNTYAVPYMWGTMGIVMDRAKVKERLGKEVWSWDLLLDVKYARKLADCGILVVDAPNDVLTAMVGAVGKPQSDLNDDSLAGLESRLTATAPYFEVVDSERFIDKVAKHEACVAVGYSGDAMQALSQADGKATALNFFIPDEGSIIWFDYFMLSQKAKGVDEALKFLDFLLKPEVAAQNTNYVQYANAVKASGPFIDEDLLKNPALYPPESVMKQLGVVNPVTPQLQRRIDQLWGDL